MHLDNLKSKHKLVPLQENNTNYSRTNHFEMSESPWTVKGPFLLLQADTHSIYNLQNPSSNRNLCKT